MTVLSHGSARVWMKLYAFEVKIVKFKMGNQKWRLCIKLKGSFLPQVRIHHRAAVRPTFKRSAHLCKPMGEPSSVMITVASVFFHCWADHGERSLSNLGQQYWINFGFKKLNQHCQKALVESQAAIVGPVSVMITLAGVLFHQRDNRREESLSNLSFQSCLFVSSHMTRTSF